MAQLYTPWMAQAGKTVGDAMTRQTQNRLYSDAYMDKPGAMEQLMRVSPQMANQLQTKKQQAQQLKLQQSAKKEAANRKLFNENRETIDKVIKDVGQFDSFEKAAVFFNQERERLRPILGDTLDGLKFTPELYEQSVTIHGDKPKEANKFQQGTGKLAGYMFNPETGEYTVNQSIRDALSSVTPEQVVDAKTRLQINKDLTALTKDTKLIRNTAKDLDNLSKIKSGPASIAMIFKFMKALDPTSVVREGEFATAENSAGIPEALRNTYNKVMSGGRLGEVQSDQFVEAAKRLANSAIESSNSEITGFLDTFEETLPKEFKDSLRKRIPQPFEILSKKQNVTPEAGFVSGGYEFIGGDPSKKENWRKQ